MYLWSKIQTVCRTYEYVFLAWCSVKLNSCRTMYWFKAIFMWCTRYKNSPRTRKVRPSTFQPLRLRPLSGARHQPCSDWLDTKHLAIVLIHPSWQGFSSWAVFLCCEQILWANFCCEQIFWANSCWEQIWFLWAVFLYCEKIFSALSNLCVDRNRVMRTYLDCT